MLTDLSLTGAGLMSKSGWKPRDPSSCHSVGKSTRSGCELSSSRFWMWLVLEGMVPSEGIEKEIFL